ncbi:MAG TPA: VWA domain-containing protein, partial [Deinococcales bacterium]|nr:VWA domain-containing protein [Deinococcales bacterium]
MSEPRVEFIPLKAAVSSTRDTTLEVLVRVTPPEAQAASARPALNLGLVIDRSGSMGGEKISYARKAARYAVGQLLQTDRVSVVAFDDRVEVVVPSALAGDKLAITTAVNGIHSRGSTDLHAGWLAGAEQVATHLDPARLNRVVLLSDGQANAGETNPDRIASQVRALQERGVSTSAYGLGLDYNEDLLEAMARSGDGNYAFIESPSQLPEIFARELSGLLATTGRSVSLGLEPQAGAAVLDVLNDLDRTQFGRFKLPNLVSGNPLDVVLRLRVPASHGGECLRVRLAWDDPKGSGRRTLRAALSLPRVN